MTDANEKKIIELLEDIKEAIVNGAILSTPDLASLEGKRKEAYDKLVALAKKE